MDDDFFTLCSANVLWVCVIMKIFLKAFTNLLNLIKASMFSANNFINNL